MRNKCVSLIATVLFGGLLRGDIAQITYDGHTLTTKENADIRMASEEVDIYWGDRIRVVASFEMQNDANKPVDLFIGFPVERLAAAPRRRDRVTGAPMDTVSERAIHDFHVTVAGHSTQVAIETIDQEGLSRTWSGWNQTFPQGKTMIRVEYYVGRFKFQYGNGLCENLLYIMHTGALWKGTIGQADIRVHFAQPVASEQIREGTWPRGWWTDGNDLCWRFKDFEPGCQDNIQIDYLPPGVYHEVQRLRKAVNEDPQDEERIVALARLYFNLYEVRLRGYSTPTLLSPSEYELLLARISDPNDRADFMRAWAGRREVPVWDRKSHSQWVMLYREVEPPRQYQVFHSLAETSIPSPRINHIMSSAGYLPQEQQSEFIAQAKEMLEQLLAKNPKNADAWLEYLANCDLFIQGAYSPQARWLRWCPTPPKQKEIVARAYAQCPTNEGIKAWHDFVTSEGANATTRGRSLPEQEIQRLRTALRTGPQTR